MPIPKLVVTAALMVAQVAMGMMRKIEGPRLDDLKVSLADYGTPIPRGWGLNRTAPQIIFAENLREKKVETKTKGGKYSEYKYYGTFGLLITDRPIAAITRIWMDKRVVYQATSAGPVAVVVKAIMSRLSSSSPVKLVRGHNMRIYLGDDPDQMPDPRYEEYCEDRYGIDSAPAYRRRATIFFEDIPLEKFGNRIPQIEVEWVSAKADAYPYEEKTATTQSSGAAMTLSPGGEWMVYASSGALEWWDTATRTRLGISGTGDGDMENVALANDGTAYYNGARVQGLDVVPYLAVTPPMGATATIDFEEDLDSPGSANFDGPIRVFDLGAVRHIYTAAGNGYVDGPTYHYVAGEHYRDFFLDSSENIWAITQPDGSSDQFTLRCLIGERMFESATLTAPTSRGAPSSAHGCHVAAEGHFFIVMDGDYLIVDAEALTLTTSGAATGFTDARLPTNNPNAASFWDVTTERSLVDGSAIRTVSGWTHGQATHAWAYDPLNHAIIARPQFVSSLFWLYLDRVASAPPTLAEVVSDVAEWCGVASVDVADLDQSVTGYLVSQGSGKDMVQPLLDLHDSFARPHDFSLQFLKRGDAAAGTLATADFARDGDQPRYTVARAQDSDLPQRLTLDFADEGKDHQVNNVISQRPAAATDSSREIRIDAKTYTMVPDDAQQYADRYMRRVWNERGGPKMALTSQQLALEPGDVRAVELDGILVTARLIKMTLAGERIDTEWVRDDPALNVLSGRGGATMDGRDPDLIYVPAPTKGFVFDGPLIDDAHDGAVPVLYYGAAPYGSGSWPGAILYQADADGDELTQWNGVEAGSAAPWGMATDALGDANPWLWDRGSSVNVQMLHGSLTSASEAALNADPSLNLARLGEEYLQFATAVLEADGTTTLSGFRRGRRGTEQHVASHAAGDEFVLLSAMASEGVGLSEVGVAMTYKAQSAGRDVDSAAAIDLTFAGAALKPRAPVIWHVTKDGTTGDITVELRSRTRVGGTWNGSAIPTGETAESYAFDVYDGATFKRTLTSATKTLTYLAADQTTDHGAEIAAEEVEGNAYQLSASVGRGFARAA